MSDTGSNAKASEVVDENSATPPSGLAKIPFDMGWVVAAFLGLLTGLLIGTLDWLREPIRNAGLVVTCIVSVLLILSGLVAMSDRRSGGHRCLGMYIMQGGGIALAAIGSSILLGAPAPFGL